jgi:hypothetical protein
MARSVYTWIVSPWRNTDNHRSKREMHYLIANIDGFILFSLALLSSAGYGLLVHEVSWLQYLRTTVGRNPLEKWSARRRDLHLTTHTTNIHASGEIRTHDRSRWAAVDLRLRPRSHWDRHYWCIHFILLNNYHSNI